MFRTSRILGLSITASAVFLVSRPLSGANWPVAFKVLSIVILAILGFRQYMLLGMALSISAVGDFCLGMSRLGGFGPEQLFLAGLSAFLFAHILYIALFRKFLSFRLPAPASFRLLGVLLILVCLGKVLGTIYSALGPLRIPVVVYAAVIATMGICAMLAKISTPLAAFGALLFIASDSMIAIGKFAVPFPASVPLIWITYYLAQLFLEQSFAKARTVK